MSEPFPPPCIHTGCKALCAGCQAEFDEDWQAYVEFGDHPAGIARWRLLQEEIAADVADRAAAGPAMRDPEIPF